MNTPTMTPTRHAAYSLRYAARFSIVATICGPPQLLGAESRCRHPLHHDSNELAVACFAQTPSID
jgi:hypothetical protein